MARTATTILAMMALIAGCVTAEGASDQSEEPQQVGGEKSEKAEETPEATTKGPTIEDEGWRIPEDKSKFHIFVLYGQSNMAGGIKERFGGTLTEQEKTPIPHILQVRFHSRRFRNAPPS